MHDDPKTKKLIRTCGRLNLPPDQICALLCLDADGSEIFLAQFIDTNSVIRRSYEQGVAMGVYKTTLQLVKLGKEGDVTALMEVNKQQEQRKIDKLRNELFGV